MYWFSNLSNWRPFSSPEKLEHSRERKQRLDGIPPHDILTDHRRSHSSLLGHTEVLLFFPLLMSDSLVGWCLRDRKAVIWNPTHITILFLSVTTRGSGKLQEHHVSIIFILDHMGTDCSPLFDRMLLCLLGRGPSPFKERELDYFDS